MAQYARMRNSLAAKLEGLGQEVEAALRPAAHAGALVFYETMRTKAPVQSGRLRDSIYRVHVAAKSGPLQQFYQVGPNTGKAPHWYWAEFGHWRYNAMAAGGGWLPSKSRKSAKVKNPPANFKAVHDLPTALNEPVFVPANPYIRPTFDATKHYAITAMQLRFAEVLKERGAIT